MHRLRPALALVVLLVLCATGVAVAAPVGGACGDPEPGVQCGPGNGRQTAGGGEKVSHAGWPGVGGILWKELGSTGRPAAGGPLNAEPLGPHRPDVLDGGAGDDILWGDWDPANNNS